MARAANIQPVYHCLAVALLCIGSVLVRASALPAVELPLQPTDEFIIGPEHLELYADATCARTAKDLGQVGWRTPTAETFPVDADSCRYLRTTISVPSGPSHWTSRAWMLEVGHHGEADVYILPRGSAPPTNHRAGNDLPVDERAYPHVWSKSYLNVVPLALDAGQQYELYVRYANPLGQTLYGTNDALALTLVPAAVVDADARLHLLFSGLMMGGLLLLCLYQLAQWWVYRTALDITYSLMLVGLMSYIMYDDFLLHALFAGRHVSEMWLYVTGALGLLGFFRLSQLTLRSVDYTPNRDRLLGYLVLGKALEVAVYLAVIGVRGFGESYRAFGAWVPEAFRLVLMASLVVFSYVIIAHFRENRDKTTMAFMLGNLSLVLGVLVVTTQAYILPFADFAPVRWYLAVIHPPFDYLIECGIVGMALCFAFAVAMLTKEREALLERTFNQRLGEVEMKALRSQMNPHFLYNGLNSIKLFVISNQPREAADYLSKFARLIRRVLENSKSQLIPLHQELETLELYLEMENLRFEERFTYSISVGDEVDLHGIAVPPTLIQPYVENAIWHGLLHRQRPGGHLDVEIEDAGSQGVHIVITDNGVGREASRAMRSLTAKKSKSLGMNITAERIEMLRVLHGFDATVSVTDRTDGDGRPAGTQVVISINAETQFDVTRARTRNFSDISVDA